MKRAKNVLLYIYNYCIFFNMNKITNFCHVQHFLGQKALGFMEVRGGGGGGGIVQSLISFCVFIVS